MSERNTVVRSLHDLGLAAWFGGSLAGAVGINGAAADVPDESLRLHVANAGWARWSPVNLTAIGAHLVGGLGLLLANRNRVRTQQGVGANTIAKAGLTAAALGVTAWSGALGARLAKNGPAPVQGGTEPAPETPSDVADAQRQLRVTQWLIPGLTAAIAVLNALHGEQQRPHQQVGGIAKRLLGAGS
jgi:hypothetical protein